METNKAWKQSDLWFLADAARQGQQLTDLHQIYFPSHSIDAIAGVSACAKKKFPVGSPLPPGYIPPQPKTTILSK
jgi:hypothetical protein